ncbi:MAG: CDP-alcohol phosphatidyltransferase family protein [Pirellulales bacterium]
MKRIPLEELERRCQKLGHREIGSWMARRVSRPLALRITWVLAPWGISAHAATLAAWACGLGAATALGWGNALGWLLCSVLLQVWYLLDHVDGQLARLRGTESLDGVQLDYLMHHTINLLVPLGAGFGLFCRQLEPLWFLAGLIWGLALLMIGLMHDTRYKAFVQRLKRLRGRLEVVGGAASRPSPSPPMPRHPGRLAAWALHKACEMHVVMNGLTLVALGQVMLGDTQLVAGQLYLAAMGSAAALVAGLSVWRSARQQRAEQEFALWYRIPEGCTLVLEDGWWKVESS